MEKRLAAGTDWLRLGDVDAPRFEVSAELIEIVHSEGEVLADVRWDSVGLDEMDLPAGTGIEPTARKGKGRPR